VRLTHAHPAQPLHLVAGKPEHFMFVIHGVAWAHLVVAIAVLGVIAVATGFVPARRAMRLDPLRALRDE